MRKDALEQCNFREVYRKGVGQDMPFNLVLTSTPVTYFLQLALLPDFHHSHTMSSYYKSSKKLTHWISQNLHTPNTF